MQLNVFGAGLQLFLNSLNGIGFSVRFNFFGLRLGLSFDDSLFGLLLFLGSFEGFGVGMIFNLLQVSVQTDVAVEDVPIATSLAYLVRILSQTMMSAVYGVILNLSLSHGVATHHGITLTMLNELSNAQTAKHLPKALLPEMRRILYSGYYNIVIAAFVLIVISLVLVLVVRRRQGGKKGANPA